MSEAHAHELGWDLGYRVAAEDSLRRLAEFVAAEAEPLWHLGDGYGGYVRCVLEQAFAEAGLPGPPPGPARKARIPAALRKAVYERDEYRCVDCGTHRDLTCDHVIPESRGGPTTFENLATRCLSCNVRKGTT